MSKKLALIMLSFVSIFSLYSADQNTPKSFLSRLRNEGADKPKHEVSASFLATFAGTFAGIKTIERNNNLPAQIRRWGLPRRSPAAVALVVSTGTLMCVNCVLQQARIKKIVGASGQTREQLIKEFTGKDSVASTLCFTSRVNESDAKTACAHAGKKK